MSAWLFRVGRWAVLALGVVVVIAAGCGSKSTPKPGKMCVLNSECNNPLSCTFGVCHAACMNERDCQAPQRCVKGPTGNVCLEPAVETCTHDSKCPSPLVCGRDLKCRNMCLADRDCPTPTQKCVEGGVCAETRELTADGKLMVPPGTPPPADAGAGAGGAGGGGMGADAAAGAGGAGGGMGGAGGTGGAGGARDAAMGGVDAGPSGGSDARVVLDAVAPVEGIQAMPMTVRQGDSAKIVVTGKNLSNPGDIMLEDLRGSVDPGGTDTMFTISVTVPHGAKLGAKTLTFTTSGGSYTKEAAITVSAITSGPMGNDNTGRGTPDSPFRTYKKALQVAAGGDTVQLLDGEYRMADGEVWTVAIPDKVTVQGQSAAGTKLIGPGESGGAVSQDGLIFMGEATVKDLTVTAFQYNIYVARPSAVVTLDNVKSIRARYNGLMVYYQATGAKVTLLGKDLEFSGHNSGSIALNAPMTTLTAMSEGSVAVGTSGAAIAVGSMKATVSLTSLTLAGTNTVYYNAINATQPEATIKLDKVKLSDGINVSGAMSTLEMIGSTITLPMTATNAAVYFTGAKLTIRGSTLQGGRYGVQQGNGTSEAIVRDTTMKDYTYYGYYLQAGKLDLGNMTERGGNTFMGPDTASAFGLYDGRSAATLSVTVSNTTFNGLRPPPGKVTGPVRVDGKYTIYTTGNVIEFFEL